MGRRLRSDRPKLHRWLRRGSVGLFLICVAVVTGVVFGPATMRAVAGEPPSTLPDSLNTGPVYSFDPSVMQPASQGDDACFLEVAGWERADPNSTELDAQRLEGEVVIGH